MLNCAYFRENIYQVEKNAVLKKVNNVFFLTSYKFKTIRTTLQQTKTTTMKTSIFAILWSRFCRAVARLASVLELLVRSYDKGYFLISFFSS